MEQPIAKNLNYFEIKNNENDNDQFQNKNTKKKKKDKQNITTKNNEIDEVYEVYEYKENQFYFNSKLDNQVTNQNSVMKNLHNIPFFKNDEEKIQQPETNRKNKYKNKKFSQNKVANAFVYSEKKMKQRQSFGNQRLSVSKPTERNKILESNVIMNRKKNIEIAYGGGNCNRCVKIKLKLAKQKKYNLLRNRRDVENNNIQLRNQNHIGSRENQLNLNSYSSFNEKAEQLLHYISSGNEVDHLKTELQECRNKIQESSCYIQNALSNERIRRQILS